MKKAIMTSAFAVFFLLSIFSVYSIDAPPGTSWWGTVTIDGSSSTNGAVIEAFIHGSKVANDVVGSDTSGYYLLNVPCSDGDTVSIRVNGILSSETNVTCNLSVVSTELNLTATSASNGAACTYDDGCTSGYCVDGYCCNSACSGSCNVCNASGHEGTCRDVNSLCSGSDSSCYCSGGSCRSCESDYTCSSYSCALSSSFATTGSIEENKSRNVTEETHIITMIKAGEKAEVDIEHEDVLGITEIVITTKEGTKDMTFVEVNVRREGKPSVLSPTGKEEHVYSYFDISVSIPNKIIGTAKIKFKVPASWISKNNIDPSTIAMYRYNDGEWTKLMTAMTGSDSGYYYFEATSPGFSLYAVKGKTKEAQAVCSEGEKKCDGNNAVICENGEWANAKVCENGCENGECKTGHATPPEEKKKEERKQSPQSQAKQQIRKETPFWSDAPFLILIIVIILAIVLVKRTARGGLFRR